VIRGNKKTGTIKRAVGRDSTKTSNLRQEAQGETQRLDCDAALMGSCKLPLSAAYEGGVKIRCSANRCQRRQCTAPYRSRQVALPRRSEGRPGDQAYGAVPGPLNEFGTCERSHVLLGIEDFATCFSSTSPYGLHFRYQIAKPILLSQRAYGWFSPVFHWFGVLT